MATFSGTARSLSLMMPGRGGGEREGIGTHLRPHQLRQRPDKLRRRVAVPAHRLVVDHLADGEPEGFFEALGVLIEAWVFGGLGKVDLPL